MKKDWIEYDREHVWHPYSRVIDPPEAYPVVNAKGSKIHLADGTVLVDGMSSWWSVIHGYSHPELNQAIKDQLDDFAHVMFGGLTHRPAADLAKALIDITPEELQYVFFSDSGSVSVEVAIKLALQYQVACNNYHRKKLLTVKGGYHGDTLGAMSVCDPETGMHSLFSNYLPEQIFVQRPNIGFNEKWDSRDFEAFEKTVEVNEKEIAAVILEPIVQGASGMWFYHPNYLKAVRNICDRKGILLIADEIATGFGRTGKLFACEHAGVVPDILCVGKALTGGYMTLAATLTNKKIAEAISTKEPKAFMHGPTFMANPLACACALQNIRLLLRSSWKNRIKEIEENLTERLSDLRTAEVVADVRILGAIGVVQLKQNVDLDKTIPTFIEQKVWIRPFKDLIYIMPPYIISNSELRLLTDAIEKVVTSHEE